MATSQERVYDAEQDRVFAALIHSLGECAAKVVAVEEFGTVVVFGFRAANTSRRSHMAARVDSASGGTQVQLVRARDGSPSDRALDEAELELTGRLFEAVQDRLDRGPGARS